MRQFWIPIVNMNFSPDGKWISLQFKCAPILNHPETVHVFADSFLMKFVPFPKTALHRCPLSLIMRFFPRGKLLFLFLSVAPAGTSTRVPSPSPSCSSTTTSWTIRTSDENRPRFWRGVEAAEVVRPWSPAVVRHCPARGSELGPVGTPGDAPGCRWMTMPSG